jgi:CHAD domain-containing protein
MAYRWKPDASSQANLRRLARNQLRAAIDELAAQEKPSAEAVHQARLRLKKLRALLRLVRGEGRALVAEENARFRDLAHALSRERDAQATIGALDQLARHAQDAWQVDAHSLAMLADARQRLADRRSGAEASGDGSGDRPGDLVCRLRAALDDVERWTSLARDDKIVWAGFQQSYRRGRRALRRALAEPKAELLHEWRKQVKYHRYQVRLFQDAWPSLLGAHYDELKRLSDLLGDDHDLVVLGHSLAEREDVLPHDQLDGLMSLIERRRAELCRDALPLGQVLYAEKPKCLTRRFRTYWRSHVES